MRTFKTKAFARFAGHEGIDDAALCEAIDRARSGAVDADMGGGVIRQRIARKGGGFRTIVLFRRGELDIFRRPADTYLALEPSGSAAAQAVGAIVEVKCDDQAIQE
ncbi:MAG: type II toxin-antitoxin system RelE/ParE family toxin [Gammaproteobacteria bacterium]|nr:type II toxin-antitoxin system RelE/ParE family toxin [Gammaproteobacteria bacterium]